MNEKEKQIQFLMTRKLGQIKFGLISGCFTAVLTLIKKTNKQKNLSDQTTPLESEQI